MCALRRFCVLVVLAIVMMLALPGAPAAAAPSLATKQANGASPVFHGGVPPCRQAQLMAAECQLEQAVLKCVKTANSGWRCVCGPARCSTAASVNTKGQAPRSSADRDVVSRARCGGLIAK